MAKKKTDQFAGQLQDAREGDPLWVATLNDGGHTVELIAKTQAGIEQRAGEIIASRHAAAEAARQGKAWDGVPQERTQLHVTP
jgi:hypothetical protein